MKYTIAILLALAFFSSVARAALSPCQEKEQDIQREIHYAEKHNNQSRINGLNKALSAVSANCRDSQVRSDHQKKIAEQKETVAERKQDLQKARQSGDADKIKKYDNKLQEAQQQLNALESRDY